MSDTHVGGIAERKMIVSMHHTILLVDMHLKIVKPLLRTVEFSLHQQKSASLNRPDFRDIHINVA
jgi:hypothetical protein